MTAAKNNSQTGGSRSEEAQIFHLSGRSFAVNVRASSRRLLQSSGGFRDCFRRRASGAFSLLELMVTVVLLSVIIVGLVIMFNQTQRAFTSSFTQVDVLESGRSVAGMIGREMEQMAPTGMGTQTNSVNFFVVSPQLLYGSQLLTQPLTDPTESVTNLLQDVYFVTRDHTVYSVAGYCIFTNQLLNGIGTLYRFCNTTPIPNTNLNALTYLNSANPGHFYYFQSSVLYDTAPPQPVAGSSNTFTRLIDGVVDFRVRAYRSDGSKWGDTNTFSYTVTDTNYVNPPPPVPDCQWALFTSNSVPAYVELEMGILEDRALAKYNSLVSANGGGAGPGSPAWNYLQNHAGAVHVFRQRIAVRNVIPAPQAFQ